MNDLFRNHFNNPHNSGEPAETDGVGEAGDAGCGAVIRIFIKFEGDVVAEARFLATGSSAAIAAASLLMESINGRSWRHAAAISPGWIEAELGLGITGDNELTRSMINLKNAATFAIDALHAAFEDSMRKGTFPRSKKQGNSVLVAMSGGVDSAVACLMEHRHERDVLGVTMRLWSDPDCADAGNATCCSPDAILDARSVCHSLGLPHLTVDSREAFEALVVKEFISEYAAGHTPNPCATCNGKFRFPELVELADRLGVEKVASGHYARIETEGGKAFISRGVDAAKDQSYMLWSLPPALLAKIEFPLGGLVKTEVRELARDAGLSVHDKKESQEICFIPDNDYRRFLRATMDTQPGAGEIVDSSGARLGVHSGYIDYTVGQRHGLRISAPEPRYVLGTAPEKNLVIVGRREELAVRELILADVNSFVSSEIIMGADNSSVQARYNSLPASGRVIDIRDDDYLVELSEPVYGVATGQSAVLYAGDTILAGGVIKATA